MTKQTNNELEPVVKQLVQVKETLLELSKKRAQLTGDWQGARTLLDLAQNADALQRQVASLVNGYALLETEPKPARMQARRMPKSEFPKFFVRGDTLVKQGLSRDRKDTYEQSVPRAGFDKVFGVLKELSASKKEFEAEAVIQSVDTPSYQVYLVLGVLKHLGLLDIPRRGAHRFDDTSTFAVEAADVWARLSASSALVAEE